MKDSAFSSLPLSLAGILSTTIIVLLTTVAIYRLFFHPYAKYPGPLLAKLTSWYSVYHTYVGDLHTDIWKCHEKYGNLVRYAPNRLLVNTEPAFKGIYSHGKNVRKSKSYLRISLIPGVHPTLGTLDNTDHAKLRRILNQGLSDSHIRTVDQELRSTAYLFAERLGELQDRFVPARRDVACDGWTASKDMAEWCDFFTFDVMSKLVFGTSYSLLTSSENHWIVDGVSGQMRRVSFLTQLPELESMGFHHFLFPQARRKALAFSKKSREIFEARQMRTNDGTTGDDQKEHTDLFSKLLSARDPDTGEALSQKQLWAESNLLIIAGSDTSSLGMAATFFYLSRNAGAYARVTREVREAFADPASVCQGLVLQSCQYLRACIQEALRLAPAASGAMWREVLSGGLHIGGTDIHIPPGLEVATGIWSLNHNQDYFPDPFVYRPERWIPGESSIDAIALAKAAFATFSIGPRSCVGRGLAMTEMLLAMAVVIVSYDFRRSATPELVHVGEGKGAFQDQYQTRWAFTSLKDGPFLQFKPLRG